MLDLYNNTEGPLDSAALDEAQALADAATAVLLHLQSSSDREIPERSRVIRAFLPDERDRGAKFAGEFLKGMVNVNVGVFDGDGIFNQGFVGADNDKEKDIIGRAGCTSST